MMVSVIFLDYCCAIQKIYASESTRLISPLEITQRNNGNSTADFESRYDARNLGYYLSLATMLVVTSNYIKDNMGGSEQVTTVLNNMQELIIIAAGQVNFKYVGDNNMHYNDNIALQANATVRIYHLFQSHLDFLCTQKVSDTMYERCVTYDALRQGNQNWQVHDDCVFTKIVIKKSGNLRGSQSWNVTDFDYISDIVPLFNNVTELHK